MKKRGEGACLVCGKPIVYDEKARQMECVMCHRQFESHAGCEDGHYVCDECHGAKGIEVILEGCKNSASKNPVELMQGLMEEPYIYMHGPEHHVMVGAALLTAYYNCGGFAADKEGARDRAAKDKALAGDENALYLEREVFETALEEIRSRGSEYPGGSCGLWGCCGAAVSAGMFMSIVTKATPLTGKSWGLSNRMTAEALKAIGELGGPRCCKRNSFTAAVAAVKFTAENLGVRMEVPEEIRCRFSGENRECIRRKCPYYERV